MKAPELINRLFNQLDNSFKILLLVVSIVSLTGFALALSSSVVQQVQHSELLDSAQHYTQELKSQLQSKEELLQQFADNEANNTFIEFGLAAKHLLEKDPSLLRLELRTDTGVLIAQRESANGKEMWGPSSRQQLPPAVLLNFLRATEQHKTYWAHSHAPSGQSAAELIIPSREKKTIWIARFNTAHWMPEHSGIAISPNIQVSLLEHAPENIDAQNTTSLNLGLSGTNTHLLFNYASTPAWQFNGVSLLLAVLGLSLCLLLVSYALDTRRYKSAREIIARQETALAKQNQLSTMAEISTTLAHELNQPLATIANYVATCEMLARTKGYDDPNLTQALSQARKEALRAGEVVQSIRNHLKRGQRVTTLINLETMVKSLQPVIGLLAKEHQSRINLELKTGLFAEVDAILLEQVIMNFCRNGFDAMLNTPTQRRELVIKTSEHKSSNGLMWARIDVKDHGHGISQTQSEKLFESFYSTKPQGMGIGLNLCRSVAESYGGRVRWKNNADQGATFSLLLPLAKPSA
jgi:signal transduction histidine kinase